MQMMWLSDHIAAHRRVGIERGEDGGAAGQDRGAGEVGARVLRRIAVEHTERMRMRRRPDRTVCDRRARAMAGAYRPSPVLQRPAGRSRATGFRMKNARRGGFHTVTPRIVVSDAPAQVEFLRTVFDATG